MPFASCVGAGVSVLVPPVPADPSLECDGLQSRPEVEVEGLTVPTSWTLLGHSRACESPWARLGEPDRLRGRVWSTPSFGAVGLVPGVAVPAGVCVGVWVGVLVGDDVGWAGGVCVWVGDGVAATVVSTGEGNGEGVAVVVEAGACGVAVSAAAVGAGSVALSCATAPAPSVAAYRLAQTRPTVTMREVMRIPGFGIAMWRLEPRNPGRDPM
jgi:hypothetical protein